jgi:membrane protein DedA with SNARE-associated domain
MISVVCFLAAGFLGGGAYSMAKQDAPRLAVVVPAVLALVAAAAGLLWLLP